MKVFVIIGLVVASCLLQAEARSIGINQELPKVLKDTMDQSFSCAMKLGPEALNVPKLQGIQQFPEDNLSLNKLWGCIWVKKEIIDEAGEVDGHKLEQYLVDLFTIFQSVNEEVLELASDITKECKNVQGNDYGQTAVKIQNCINGKLQDKLNLA